MATPTLPSEVIANILSRLRVKPLLRFKCVSKSWYSLINSTIFIKLHLSQTLTSDNHPNLLVSNRSLSSAVIDKNLRSISFSELDHPLKHFLAIQILGSCNGVVIISDYPHESVFLYNPSTKTHRLVPSFYPSPQTNPIVENIFDVKNVNIVVFGFGYDSVSDDYKVLRVIETRKNNAVVYRETAVYSLRSDSWKCVVDEQLRNFQLSNGGLFNENLHFMVAIDSTPGLGIKCFNLGTEKFSIFNIPKKQGGRFSTYTGELGGYFCLGLNYVNRKGNYENWIQEEDSRLVKTDFWVMKEYGKEESWVKLFTFSAANISGISRQVRPVVYSKDKRRLLLDVDASWLGWYDIERNKFKRIKAFGIPATPLPFESWTSVDSLVSLHKDEVKSKGGTAINKIQAHGTPALSAIMKTRTEVDSHVSLHEYELKSKGGSATKKKGKHSVSKEQVNQDAHSVGRTSYSQGDDFNLRVRTEISSRTCSTLAIDNLSKDFMLRLTRDATDRT